MRGWREVVNRVLIGWSLVGMEQPPERGNNFGMRIQHGLSSGSPTLIWTQSGPG
jgi:hypothetical protein